MAGVAEQISNLNDRLTAVETMAQVELTNWRSEVDQAIQDITSLESTSIKQLCALVDTLRVGFESQEARILGLEKADKPKHDARHRREILESPAIQQMEKLYDNKNYRQWLERFKNALEQARPGDPELSRSCVNSKTKTCCKCNHRLSSKESKG